MDKRDKQRKETRLRRCDKVGMRLSRLMRITKKRVVAEIEHIEAHQHMLEHYPR